MSNSVEGAHDWSGYSMWMPGGAKRALCAVYGTAVPADVMAGLAEHVDVDLAALGSGSFDVVMLIGHPDARGRVDENQSTDFIASIGHSWEKLGSGGVLLVAFDPGRGRTGAASTVQAWLSLRNWSIAFAIERKIRSVAQTPVTRLHVFPSVWRPVLMHTPESPAALKRLAFAHIGGWRGGVMSGPLLSGGRWSPLDLCPAGIVWIASR